MTGPRIASVCIVLLVLVPPLPVAACDVPSQLLAGRTLSETRKVLRGEVVFVAERACTTSRVGRPQSRVAPPSSLSP